MINLKDKLSHLTYRQALFLAALAPDTKTSAIDLSSGLDELKPSRCVFPNVLKKVKMVSLK